MNIDPPGVPRPVTSPVETRTARLLSTTHEYTRLESATANQKDLPPHIDSDRLPPSLPSQPVHAPVAALDADVTREMKLFRREDADEGQQHGANTSSASVNGISKELKPKGPSLLSRLSSDVPPTMISRMSETDERVSFDQDRGGIREGRDEISEQPSFVVGSIGGAGGHGAEGARGRGRPRRSGKPRRGRR